MINLKNLFLFLFLFIYVNASTIKIESNEIINVLPNSEILVPDKFLSLNEALINENWKKTNKRIINFNYSTIPRWIRFDINKSTSDKLFLEFGLTTIDVVNIFLLKDNKVIKEYKTGLNRKFQSRPISSNNFIFPINIKKEEIYTVYVETSNNLQPNLVSLILYTEDIFHKRDFFYNFISGLLISLLLFMFYYNLIIYTFIPFSAYKYYLMYIISVIFLILTELGYAYKYFYPNQILLNKIVIHFAEFLFLFILTIFIKNILELKEKSFFTNSLNFLLSILFILNIIHMYLYYISSEYIIYFASLNSFFVLILLIIITISIFSEYKKGNNIAKFLMIPWFLPIVSVFMYVVNRLFFFLDLNIFNILMQLTFMLEAMLMSLIIGLKISYIKKEKSELIIKNKNAEINLLQESKFAAMGRMLSHITHQWKQPLMRINSIILDIDTKLSKDLKEKHKIDKYLDLIENETDYMAKTIRTFSKYFHPHKELVDINLYNILEEIITLYKSQFEKKYIFVEIHCTDKNITTLGYNEELKQVLIILFENALDSFEENSKNRKIISCEISKDETLPFISIESNGPCIKKENISQVFDPYFSTKSNKNNEGLGLYIAKMLIEESMHKKIEVGNTKAGVKFWIKG